MTDASAPEIISASAEDTLQNCHSDPQDALLRGLRLRNLLLPFVIEHAQAR